MASTSNLDSAVSSKSTVLAESRRKTAMTILLAALIMWSVAEYVSNRYLFAMNIQLDGRCVPEDYFIVDTWVTDLSEGDYVYFHAKRMEPWIADGEPVIKKVAATPGGLLEVKAGNAWVNGTDWGPLDRLEKLGRTASEFERSERVPEGHILAMGTLPRSYDGRYWGFVQKGQIVGKAIAIF